MTNNSESKSTVSATTPDQFENALAQLAQQTHELELASARIGWQILQEGVVQEQGFSTLTAYLKHTMNVTDAAARRITADTSLLYTACTPDNRKRIEAGKISLALARWIHRQTSQLDKRTRTTRFNEFLHTVGHLPVQQAQAQVKEEVAKLSLETKANDQHRRAGLRRRRDGSLSLTAVYTGDQAAQIREAIEEKTSQEHRGEKETRSKQQRAADALHTLITTGEGIPNTKLAVVIPVKPDEQATFMTNRGDKLTAPQAKRLAAKADQCWALFVDELTFKPLALGHSQRLASYGQRFAMLLQQHTCIVPDCTHPASKCQAHHVTEWASNGPTDIDNLVYICPHHHELLTQGHTTLTPEPDGVHLRYTTARGSSIVNPHCQPGSAAHRVRQEKGD